MKKVNILKILENEKIKKNKCNSKLSNKDYACHYVVDVLTAYMIEFVEPKIKNIDDSDEFYERCFNLLENLYYSNDKKKEYYDFTSKDNIGIKNEIADYIINLAVKSKS